MARWDMEPDEATGQWFVLKNGELWAVAASHDEAVTAGLRAVAERQLSLRGSHAKR